MQSEGPHQYAGHPGYVINPRLLWPGDPAGLFTVSGSLYRQDRKRFVVGVVVACVLALTFVLSGLPMFRLLAIACLVLEVIRMSGRWVVLSALYGKGQGAYRSINEDEGRIGDAWEEIRQLRRLTIEIRQEAIRVGVLESWKFADDLAPLEEMLWFWTRPEGAPRPHALDAEGDQARALFLAKDLLLTLESWVAEP